MSVEHRQHCVHIAHTVLRTLQTHKHTHTHSHTHTQKRVHLQIEFSACFCCLPRLPSSMLLLFRCWPLLVFWSAVFFFCFASPIWIFGCVCSRSIADIHLDAMLCVRVAFLLFFFLPSFPLSLYDSFTHCAQLCLGDHQIISASNYFSCS